MFLVLSVQSKGSSPYSLAPVLPPSPYRVRYLSQTCSNMFAMWHVLSERWVGYDWEVFLFCDIFTSWGHSYPSSGEKTQWDTSRVGWTLCPWRCQYLEMNKTYMPKVSLIETVAIFFPIFIMTSFYLLVNLRQQSDIFQKCLSFICSQGQSGRCFIKTK